MAKVSFFRNFFPTVLHTVNPFMYRDLSTRPLKAGLAYLLSVFVMSLFILFIISIPFFVNSQSYFASQLEAFDSINISIAAHQNRAVSFGSFGVGIDLSSNATSEPVENLLITSDSIIMKPFWCAWFEPSCLLASGEDYSRIDTKSLKTPLLYSKELSKHFTTLLILLLPAFLIILFVLYAVKYLILIAFFSILGFAALEVMGRSITLRQAFNTALYSSTPFIVLEIADIGLGLKLSILPIVAFAAWFALNVFIVARSIK